MLSPVYESQGDDVGTLPCARDDEDTLGGGHFASQDAAVGKHQAILDQSPQPSRTQSNWSFLESMYFIGLRHSHFTTYVKINSGNQVN